MAKKLSIFCLICISIAACTTSGVGGGSPDPAPSVAALSVDGPYEIRGYLAPDVAEFDDATIYYPINATAPVGGVAIAPGFTEGQRHIDWWGPRLASHGYAVLVFDTNTPRDMPDIRGNGLLAGVNILRAENTRAGSPLNGKIDTGKMAIMGHSMGGGGTLLAANGSGDQIQAAIPFTPWQPEGDFSNITAPTLVIAGSADQIAGVSDHAWPHYLSIPSTTTKVYMEVEGGDHFLANSGRNKDHATIGRYAIAWLKLYLDGDERYADFIYGDAAMADRPMFSRYVTNP